MFQLPLKTKVNKVVPKNAFHKYATTNQKKQLTNKIERITWKNKLSSGTINLSGKKLEEIQIFQIELKEKSEIADILKLIDKTIPYHIIFIVTHKEDHFISASKKHLHPTNEDQAVIDWTFKTEWLPIQNMNLTFNLKINLDTVFDDICFQISGSKEVKEVSIETLIDKEQQIKKLNTQIQKLESQIKNCKQFNKKVELNMQLEKVTLEVEQLNN